MTTPPFWAAQPRVENVDMAVYGYDLNSGGYTPVFGAVGGFEQGPPASGPRPEARMSGSYGRPEGPALRSPVGGVPNGDEVASGLGGIPAHGFGGLHAGQAQGIPEAHGIPVPMPGGTHGQVMQLGGAPGGPGGPGQGGPGAAGPQAPQMRTRPHPVPRPESPAEAAARAAHEAQSGVQTPVGGGGQQRPPSSEVQSPFQRRTLAPYQNGHPSAGQNLPFRGPGHSMPMNAGEPNFAPFRDGGGGMGVWANAPRPVTAYQGEPFPTGAPGTYVPNASGTGPGGAFGGFAGAAERQQRREARQAEANQRTVDTQDGYIYQQFSDGRIRVLRSGDPRRLPHGSFLPPGSTRWNAVTGQIGSWASYIQARRAAGAGAVAQGLTAGAQIIGAFTGGGRGGRGRGRKGRKGRGGMAPAPDDLAVEAAPVEEPGSFPWLPVAGLAALGLGVMVLIK